ncbi:MAG: M24 family metallopeptidase [Syntrophales bacterium]|jgi:Xaa-Pro aminopeptidase
MHREPPVPPERMTRVRAILHEHEIDALLFLDMKNVRYLTGFTGSDGALVIGEKQEILLVDGRYTNQARKEVEGPHVFEYKEKIDGIAAVLSDGSLRSAGFESQAMNVNTYLTLKEKIGALRLNPLSNEIDALRAVKDEKEIAYIRRAAEISCEALTAVRDLIKPGVRETDIAIELDFQVRRRGAEQVSFPTIVATGANSAQPHAQPGLRAIKNGDMVIVDYGAVYCGYHSDETCTFAVGHKNENQEKVYTLVKNAHDRALGAIQAGVPCVEIDRTARDCIKAGKLGKYFTHGTGHGVGLDVHEAPRIAIKSEMVLEAGMVLTIEPGVYIPDLWGVRIEDTILVTEEGFEVLTGVSKNFTVLH